MYGTLTALSIRICYLHPVCNRQNLWCVIYDTRATVYTNGSDHFVLRNPSIQLTISHGRITSLLDIKLRYISWSAPWFSLNSDIAVSLSTKATPVDLLYLKIGRIIGMLGVCSITQCVTYELHQIFPLHIRCRNPPPRDRAAIRVYWHNCGFPRSASRGR